VSPFWPSLRGAGLSSSLLPLMLAAAAAGVMPARGQDAAPSPPAAEPPVKIWTPEAALDRGSSSSPAPPAPAGAPVPIDPATGERLVVPRRGVAAPPAGALPSGAAPPPPVLALPSMPAMVPGDLPPAAGIPRGGFPPGMLPPAPPPPGTVLPPGALPPGMAPRRPPATEVLPGPLPEGSGALPGPAGAAAPAPPAAERSGPAAWMFLLPLLVLAGGVALFLVERRRRLRRGPLAAGPPARESESGRP